MRRINLAVSLALLALAGFTLFEGGKLPFGTFRSPQTAFFPRILAFLLLICCLILLAQALRSKESGLRPAQVAIEGWTRIGATLLTMVGFALLLETLGFLLSTFLLMILLLRAIEALRWQLVIGIAFSTSILCYFLFAKLLNVPLPTGILGI